MKQIEGMAVARAFFSVMNLTNLYKFSRNIDDEGPIREFDSDSQAGTTATGVQAAAVRSTVSSPSASSAIRGCTFTSPSSSRRALAPRWVFAAA